MLTRVLRSLIGKAHLEPVTEELAINQKALNRVRLELLKGKTWRYLRYIHARYALNLVTDWDNLLVVGGGYGLAEVALAIENPKKHFHLTDYDDATHSFKSAKAFKKKYGLENITFGKLDILEKQTEKFDVVYSIEVLEHIQNDNLAAQNMLEMASKYVFCLVPFAEPAVNDNPRRRARAMERHEHFVVGYDQETLTRLFPTPLRMQGCYWSSNGVEFRKQLTDMELSDIEIQYQSLSDLAKHDIRQEIPTSEKQANGIWVLSKTKRRFF